MSWSMFKSLRRDNFKFQVQVKSWDSGKWIPNLETHSFASSLAGTRHTAFLLSLSLYHRLVEIYMR